LDSDPLTRTIILEMLQRAGNVVMAAGDVGTAVDRLRMWRPDLLIVRPYINSMTGAMAAKYLRTRCPGLPVLIVDGYMNDDRVRVETQVHEFHLFPQPFESEELVDKVKNVLRAVHAKAR
jgi:CheY-like chemotaxis protein